MELKELRKNKKITQNKISSELNIPITTYKRYENEERTPNIETLIKLANFYNVSLDYLVGRNFNNEFGYLNEQEKMLLNIFKKLNSQNQLKLVAEATGMFIAQG